jgi:hypothetical protein
MGLKPILFLRQSVAWQLHRATKNPKAGPFSYHVTGNEDASSFA